MLFKRELKGTERKEKENGEMGKERRLLYEGEKDRKVARAAKEAESSNQIWQIKGTLRFMQKHK